MANATPTTAFDPPGPGQWDLDRSHFPGGTTPLAQWLMEGCAVGTGKVFAELGMPARQLDAAFVHGFMYTRLRPLVGGNRAATKTPPALVLKIASRVHPAFRRCNAAAGRALREHPWRRIVADWHATTRPALEAGNLAFGAVDLGGLDDAGLADHVERLLAWCRDKTVLHFYLHGYDLGPIGMLLYDCERWGIGAADVVPALGGASPATSEPARIVRELRTAVEAAGADPRSLDDVRAVSPETAELLDRYLRNRGAMMVTRYDLDGQTLAERPDTVLATIRSARDPVDHGAADAAAAAARARVPAAEVTTFDERLAEARAAMDLRDDNGPYTVEWPWGLLRLALLEAGRRRVATGAVAAPDLALELRPEEVPAFVRHGTGPSGAELTARAAERTRQAALDPPPLLGPIEPPPPLELLPESLRVLVGTVQTVLSHLGMTANTTGTPARSGSLEGTGVGTATHRGRARVATDPEAALDALEPGDVLVVRFTTPAYNTVLSLAGAVVTTDGGPLCHAAVMARELGIPAVIGVAGAMQLIADGAEVEVDAAAGTVRVLTPAG